MLKQKILRILNILLFLNFLIVLSAQLIYQFHPELQGEESVLNFHTTGGYIFVILVGIHLILNFSWVKSAYFKKRKK